MLARFANVVFWTACGLAALFSIGAITNWSHSIYRSFATAEHVVTDSSHSSSTKKDDNLKEGDNIFTQFDHLRDPQVLSRRTAEKPWEAFPPADEHPAFPDYAGPALIDDNPGSTLMGLTLAICGVLTYWIGWAFKYVISG
jgi:hypothetical protein